jgi:ankyrin repeat protein
LQRSFGGCPPERKEALRKEALCLCERNLADREFRLWPFPNKEPSVGGMIGVAAHVQAAQFGQVDELRALLDESPELIDQVNDRDMTALMSAAHGGHAAVVTMLLERGADVTCRDDRGVSALEYAIREDRQEVVLAILGRAGHVVVNAVGPRGTTALLVACEHGREAIAHALLDRGAKVDALKKGLNIESATMLAKIGTEKGIMVSGIKCDQTTADFSNQNLNPPDAILLASDLSQAVVTGALTSINLSKNRLTNFGGDMTGIKELAAALGVNGGLTALDLSFNNLNDDSVSAVCEAIQSNKETKLASLNMGANSIGPVGAKSVAAMVAVTGTLMECDVSNNAMSEEGKASIRFAAQGKAGFNLHL